MYRSIYRVIKLTAKIAVFLIALLALGGVVIIGLTQVPSFRAWMVTRGLSALNGQLQGKVEVGEVTGDLFRGLRLHDVRLLAANTTLLTARVVDVKYQLLPLLRQRVIGAEAVIYSPDIRLIRNATDSTWNFEHITKPSTDSIKTPFNWTIDLASLDIRDAKVSLHDLTVPEVYDTVGHAVNYQHLDITEFNLALQAHIAPTSQSIWIQNLAFNVPRPDVRVVELSGNITLDTTGLSVLGLRLETDRTLMSMSGRVDSINFFQAGVAPMHQWRRYPVSIELDGDRVSTLELKRFIPAVAFLGGTPAIKLSAHGRYGDMAIRQLVLDLAHSHIAIEGRLKNLNVPDSLFIDARMSDSHLSYEDVPIYVPGLHIPNLAYLGPVTVRRASFTGPPQDFVSTVDISTAVGSAKGGAWLDVRGDRLKYNADLAVLHADLAPIVKDNSLKSDLTGRVLINGTGTSLDELDADVRALMDGSTIYDRSVRKLYFDGHIRDRGFVQVDTLMVAAGEKSAAPAVTPASLDELERILPHSLNQPMGSRNVPTAADRAELTSANSIAAGGWFDYRNRTIPRYSLRAQGRSFDPAWITQERAGTSRLSFVADVTGSGLAPDDLQGNANVRVLESVANGRQLPPFQAEVHLTREDRLNRTLKVVSDLADVEIGGRWRFETIIPSILQGFQGVADYIGRKASYRGESLLLGAETPFTEQIAANYALTLKNLEPLELFLGGARLRAEGEISGEISGTSQLLSISANGTLRNLLYQQDSMMIQLAATTLSIDLRNIAPNHIEDISSAEIVIRSDSTARYNDLSFAAPNATVTLDAGLLSFRGSTAVNGKVSVAVDGSVDATDERGYGIRLDTMIVAIPGGNQWRNVMPVSAVVSEGRVAIDTFMVQRIYLRRPAEIVSVSGALAGSKFEDVRLAVRQGSLRELPTFLEGDMSSTVQPLEGNLRLGEFRINGTLDAPLIDGELRIDSIAYSGAPIGNLQGSFHYADRNMTGRLIVSDIRRTPEDTAVLQADIDIASFPIDLAVSPAGERFPSDRPVSITARTNDLPIAFLAPFLPGAQVMAGIADVNFTVGGTMPKLAFSGTGQVNNAKVLIEGNNIVYYANARLSFQDQTLTIEQAVVQNDPRDLVGGVANVQGKIQFDGFSISRLDIEAETSRLLVLSDATQAVNNTVYGDLVIGTVGGPIKFSGPLDQPKLEGEVQIINGNLRFPENTSTSENTNVVKYIDFATWQRRVELPYGPPGEDVADSTAAAGTDSLTAARTDSSSLLSASEQLLREIERTSGLQTGGDLSLADKILFDLYISVAGRLFITMDISPVEQLLAEIANQGRPLHLVRGKDGVNKLTGTLAVLQGSKYNFLKSFDASGTLTFRENISNPELSLTANYDGRIVNPDGSTGQEFQVTVTITGTKETPVVTFSYTIEGRRPTITDQTEQTRNAITLLLFNRTSDQLASGNVVGSTVTNTVGSTGSLAVSRVLSDIFTSSIGFVRSVSLDVGNNRPGEFGRTRLNVVSQFGRFVLRYGGEISSPSDGIIAVDLPLAAVSNVDLLRNIVLQIEREARTLETGTGSPGSATTQAQTFRFRIQYRVSY